MSDYEEIYRTYKGLILEILDINLFSNHDPWREKYRWDKSKNFVRIKDINEEFGEVMDRLVHSRGTFLGYDMGGGHLVRNYYDVSNWMGNIKRRLTAPLDIKNAILEEMARQKKEKGLVLETLASQVKETRQKRNSVTVKIDNKDNIELPKCQALLLLALRDVVKKEEPKNIRPIDILMKVWPGEVVESKDKFRYHWSKLRNELKGYTLPGFEHYFDGYVGYCLGTRDTPWKPPGWIRKIKFSKDLRLPPPVSPNR